MNQMSDKSPTYKEIFFDVKTKEIKYFNQILDSSYLEQGMLGFSITLHNNKVNYHITGIDDGDGELCWTSVSKELISHTCPELLAQAFILGWPIE